MSKNLRKLLVVLVCFVALLPLIGEFFFVNVHRDVYEGIFAKVQYMETCAWYSETEGQWPLEISGMDIRDSYEKCEIELDQVVQLTGRYKRCLTSFIPKLGNLPTDIYLEVEPGNYWVAIDNLVMTNEYLYPSDFVFKGERGEN